MADSSNNPEHSGPQDVGTEMLRYKHGQIIKKAYDQLNGATFEEIRAGKRYVLPAPLAIKGIPDVVCIMLTRDGIRPFRDEQKEHFIVYFAPEFRVPIIWFDHIKEDGDKEQFTMTPDDLGPRITEDLGMEELGLLDDDSGRWPHPSEFGSVVTPERKMSLWERLSILEERFERFLPTPQRDRLAA